MYLLPQSPSILGGNIVPIDLNTALRLAGAQNPEVLVALRPGDEAVGKDQGGVEDAEFGRVGHGAA